MQNFPDPYLTPSVLPLYTWASKQTKARRMRHTRSIMQASQTFAAGIATVHATP